MLNEWSSRTADSIHPNSVKLPTKFVMMTTGNRIDPLPKTTYLSIRKLVSCDYTAKSCHAWVVLVENKILGLNILSRSFAGRRADSTRSCRFLCLRASDGEHETGSRIRFVFVFFSASGVLTVSIYTVSILRRTDCTDVGNHCVYILTCSMVCNRFQQFSFLPIV